MMAHGNDIKTFLESGMLEQHALGLTSPDEAALVEDWLAKSDEARSEWLRVQETLEMAALESAVSPPVTLEQDIMAVIESDTKATKPSKSGANIRRINRMVVAASIAAFLFLAAALSEWNRSETYKREIAQLQERVEALESELEGEQLKFAALETEMSTLSDPRAQKITLSAQDLSLVAYWNASDQKSWLQVVEHPELPQSECLQLWADVHGEMISLGVIPNEPGLISLDFKVDAESLNVTIEPAGGSASPNVARLVVSQTI